jgi:glyoxylase-like metal-dependent hydrolase (beta-lactamase superfamily II)
MTPEPSDLQAVLIPVTPFQQNCTLLWSKATRACVFIDPGGETARLKAAAVERGLSPEAIWLTHGHLDHAGGANRLARELGVAIIGPHADDQWLLDRIPEDWARYGVHDSEACTPSRYLADGDRLTLSGHVFEVVHCPGHTPGHVAILHRGARLAFVGDLLFKGSIGRTDFPRGNFDDLVASITGKLWPYGDDMRFVPGHGEMGTFGWERKTNPFVSDLALGRA